jgi:hypothetical protein
MARAGSALYQAKKGGRDRVVIADAEGLEVGAGIPTSRNGGE